MNTLALIALLAASPQSGGLEADTARSVRAGMHSAMQEIRDDFRQDLVRRERVHASRFIEAPAHRVAAAWMDGQRGK